MEKWKKQSTNNRSSGLGQIEMTNDGYVKYKVKDGKEDEGEDDEYQDLNHERSEVACATAEPEYASEIPKLNGDNVEDASLYEDPNY